MFLGYCGMYVEVGGCWFLMISMLRGGGGSM